MHVLIPHLLALVGDGSAGFRLQVSVGTSKEMTAELEAARLDFVIARRTAADGGSLAAERLYNEKTVVVCGRQNDAAGSRTLTLEQLAIMQWVLPKKGFYSRDALDALLSASGLPAIVPVIECDSFESNLSVAASTRFLTVAPEFAARRFERLRMVRIVQARPSLGASPVMLQFRAGQRLHPSFAAFHAAAVQAARQIALGRAK